MPKIIFLDTNIYLHYQDIEQINWLEIAQADNVTIIVPPITVRELNKNKEIHPRKRIRKRAGATLTKLFTLFSSTHQTQLNDVISIHLEDRDPILDSNEFHLNPEIQDDNLIASIIMYRSEYPDSDIILVTSDAGLLLHAKAKRYGIKPIKLPDSLKLPEEPDPEQIRRMQLEKELQELKQKVPQLSLTFEDGSQQATIILSNPLALTQEEIEKKVIELKELHLKKSETPKHAEDLPKANLTTKEVFEMGKASLTNAISPEDIAKYNTELEVYFQEYVEFMQNEIQFENLRRRTIMLELFLTNEGTAPAEDIDIFMHFPDGLIVMSENGLMNPPKHPIPPSRPKTEWEKLLQPMRELDNIPFLGTDIYRPIQPYTPTNPNVSSPNIRSTDSYSVDVHVQSIKHGLRESFDELYVIFESFNDAHSFHIDYKLLAANLPSETSGRIHIIIQKEE